MCAAGTYTNLFFHGDGEEDDKVEDKDRPEDRDVEELKHCTQHADQQRLQRTVPVTHTHTHTHNHGVNQSQQTAVA